LATYSAKATEATTQTTTARIPPGVIQRNGCRALGEAQYSRANRNPTISSSTGHLARSQTLTAVLPIPSSWPRRSARPPVATTATAEAASRTMTTTVTPMRMGRVF
jgi:hypothetical protein